MLTAMLLAVAVAAATPDADQPTMGACTRVGQSNATWPADLRHETRARVQRACREVGASKAVCAFADAVVIRESSGRAGVRHTLGPNEHGLGAMGLSLRWHRDKWPGRDEDPQWCKPEASFAVAHALWWRAVTRYHAQNLLDVQAIYAGRWHCFFDPKGKRQCFANPSRQTIASICGRLKARGHSCFAPLTRKDLGKRVPRSSRRQWALDMFETFDPQRG